MVIDVEGEQVLVNILDTIEGNTVFGTSRYVGFQNADVYFLLYDLTSHRSFHEVQYYLSLIGRIRCCDAMDQLRIVLCGTKSDQCSTWRQQLPSSKIFPSLRDAIQNHFRKSVDCGDIASLILDWLGSPSKSDVSTLQGLHFAKDINAVFFEISSLNTDEVAESFHACIDLVLQSKSFDR